MSVSAFCFWRQRDRGWCRAAWGHDIARTVGGQPLLVERVTVIGGDAGRGVDVQAVRHALMAMIDGDLVGWVDRHDLSGCGRDRLRHQEGRDGGDVQRGIQVLLDEAWRLFRGFPAIGRGEQAVGTWEGAEVMVEGLIFMIDDKYIFYMLAQQIYLLLDSQFIRMIAFTGP